MSQAGQQGDRRAYHVQAVLGSGGFGAVYRAKYVGEGSFSKIVALKVLHADKAAVDEVAMRMRDEARMLGLLRHRNIVQVDRLVQLNGRWTIVMEYVDGVDLKEISRAVPLPIGPALEVVSEVASALHQAYNYVPIDDSIPADQRKPLEILHRDIKPANIQLTRHGDVKVLDFGIARGNFDAREAKTQELFFGSPEYTAPERFDLEETPAGDIYSLGCVLYEILMGKPYGRTSARPTQHQDLIEARLSLLDNEALGGDAPELLELLTEMLAYEGANRPSARQVERRAKRMRGRFDEPFLRDWAEDTLPSLLDARTEQPPDDLTGSTLYELVTGSQPMPRAPAEPRQPPRKPPRSAPSLGPAQQKPRRSIREAFAQQQAQQSGSAAAAPSAEPAVAPEPAPAPSSAPAPPVEPEPQVLAAEPEAPSDPELATDPGLPQQEPAPAPPVRAPHPGQEVPTTCVDMEQVAQPERAPEPAPKKWEPAASAAAPSPAAAPTPPAQPVPEPEQPERPAWLIPVGVLGALTVIAAAAGVAFMVLKDPTPSPEPAPAPHTPDVATAPAQPGPAVPPVKAPDAQPKPPVPAPDPQPVAKQDPPPSKPKPAPKPKPEPVKEEDIAPAGTSMVKIQGQDLGVILKGAEGSYGVPGWVPPGTYTITAEFPGFGRTKSGTATVVAGADATISCDPDFGKCKQI
jgi:serine/threonine protein kinase